MQMGMEYAVAGSKLACTCVERTVRVAQKVRCGMRWGRGKAALDKAVKLLYQRCPMLARCFLASISVLLSHPLLVCPGLVQGVQGEQPAQKEVERIRAKEKQEGALTQGQASTLVRSEQVRGWR